MTVVIKKMILTGAMTIIQPGSSAQLVIALLVVQVNMLFVLKLGPFVDTADDYLSFLTSGQMCLTLLGGLLLMTDNPTSPTYGSDMMGTILIVINSFGFVALILSLFALHPKIRACLNKRNNGSNRSGTEQKDGILKLKNLKNNSTKVAPIPGSTKVAVKSWGNDPGIMTNLISGIKSSVV